jgi:xanthine dehydrogenase YagS FAD-binding subunit
MSIVHDVIPPFQLFQPTTLDEAADLLRAHGDQAWVMAGGMDSFDWLKDRTKRTDTVIELSQVEELKGIRERDGGLEIGAMTTLTDVAESAVVRERFGLLAEAASLVASPQIRNQGTLGGNISQDTRCWYYRSGWTCYRAGGNTCYADTPSAVNREHAILHASRCVAVNPSDTAPALVALDAQMVIRNGDKERVVEAVDYFVGPEVDIRHMTILEPGDLLTAIRVPSTWAGSRFYFEKVRDRNVWDFPLVNVASAVKESGGRIQDLRVVVGAVAARPLRLVSVERALSGQLLGAESIARAAAIQRLQGPVDAQPGPTRGARRTGVRLDATSGGATERAPRGLPARARGVQRDARRVRVRRRGRVLDALERARRLVGPRRPPDRVLRRHHGLAPPRVAIRRPTTRDAAQLDQRSAARDGRRRRGSRSRYRALRGRATGRLSADRGGPGRLEPHAGRRDSGSAGVTSGTGSLSVTDVPRPGRPLTATHPP